MKNKNNSEISCHSDESQQHQLSKHDDSIDIHTNITSNGVNRYLHDHDNKSIHSNKNNKISNSKHDDCNNNHDHVTAAAGDDDDDDGDGDDELVQELIKKDVYEIDDDDDDDDDDGIDNNENLMQNYDKNDNDTESDDSLGDIYLDDKNDLDQIMNNEMSDDDDDDDDDEEEEEDENDDYENNDEEIDIDNVVVVVVVDGEKKKMNSNDKSIMTLKEEKKHKNQKSEEIISLPSKMNWEKIILPQQSKVNTMFPMKQYISSKNMTFILCICMDGNYMKDQNTLCNELYSLDDLLLSDLPYIFSISFSPKLITSQQNLSMKYEDEGPIFLNFKNLNENFEHIHINPDENIDKNNGNKVGNNEGRNDNKICIEFTEKTYDLDAKTKRDFKRMKKASKNIFITDSKMISPEKYFEKYNDGKIVSSRQSSQWIRKYVECQFSIPQFPGIYQMQVSLLPNIYGKKYNSLHTFRIEKPKIDAQKSEIIVDANAKPCRVNELTCFIVKARSSDSRDIVLGGDVDCFDVKIEQSNNMTLLDIKGKDTNSVEHVRNGSKVPELIDFEDGTYGIEFEPKMVGNHTLHVLCHNKHIMNSPYCFTVYLENKKRARRKNIINIRSANAENHLLKEQQQQQKQQQEQQQKQEEQLSLMQQEDNQKVEWSYEDLQHYHDTNIKTIVREKNNEPKAGSTIMAMTATLHKRCHLPVFISRVKHLEREVRKEYLKYPFKQFERDAIMWRLTLMFPGNLDQLAILRRIFIVLRYGGLMIRYQKKKKKRKNSRIANPSIIYKYESSDSYNTIQSIISNDVELSKEEEKENMQKKKNTQVNRTTIVQRRKSSKLNSMDWKLWSDTNWPIASALSHGGRVLIQLPFISEEDAAKMCGLGASDDDKKKLRDHRFINWLITGKHIKDNSEELVKSHFVSTKSWNGEETQQEGKVIYKRLAGTHGIEYQKNKFSENMPYGRKKLCYETRPIGFNFRNTKVFQTKSIWHHRHWGMNIPLGGHGNIAPTSELISSNGEHGHMYINYMSCARHRCGGLLIGVEPSEFNKCSQSGHKHTIIADSSKISPTWGYKWNYNSNASSEFREDLSRLGGPIGLDSLFVDLSYFATSSSSSSCGDSIDHLIEYLMEKEKLWKDYMVMETSEPIEQRRKRSKAIKL